MYRLRGKVLLKGRRITDKKEDYYQGSTFDDSDTEDSEIEEEHTMDRDDRPVSLVLFRMCSTR